MDIKNQWDEIIRAAQKLPSMTEEQKQEHRVSFVFGNVNIENDKVTREMVEKIAKENPNS